MQLAKACKQKELITLLHIFQSQNMSIWGGDTQVCILGKTQQLLLEYLPIYGESFSDNGTADKDGIMYYAELHIYFIYSTFFDS